MILYDRSHPVHHAPHASVLKCFQKNKASHSCVLSKVNVLPKSIFRALSSINLLMAATKANQSVCRTTTAGQFEASRSNLSIRQDASIRNRISRSNCTCRSPGHRFIIIHGRNGAQESENDIADTIARCRSLSSTHNEALKVH